ncbi:hypothetical protein QUF64_13220 [Anaerolineales bacterium HSG6]|nr:hypothetical protein [Anaerolineales bacterium HSG6]MDM8531040.1 hypothetical protein [Anaerolineales bacterium HSG25]
MSKQKNLQAILSISGSPDALDNLDTLQEKLCSNITLAVQETLGVTSLSEIEVNVNFGPIDEEDEDGSENEYDASAHLVQLITSDFDGTLYPFALALGSRVEEYIEHLQKTGRLEKKLSNLDTEMHQWMTEVARTYARTGKWR